MKQTFLVFLLTFFLLGFLSISASAMPVSWNIGNVGISGNDDYDSNDITGLFDEMTFYAETTVTQYDSDGDSTVSNGDAFVNDGALVGTGFVPKIDGEGMGNDFSSTWELTGTMEGFGGTVTNTEFNSVTGDTHIEYQYNTGTLKLYADGTPDYDFNDRGYTDDTGFNGGTSDSIHVGTFDVIYGLGDTYLDLAVVGDVENRGHGEFMFQSSYLRPDFWYNEAGEDLSFIYGSENPVNWFVNFVDFNVDDPEVTLGGPTDNFLYMSDVTHDGSFEFSAVPEPATMILLGLGLLGLAGISRKKFIKKN